MFLKLSHQVSVVSPHFSLEVLHGAGEEAEMGIRLDEAGTRDAAFDGRQALEGQAAADENDPFLRAGQRFPDPLFRVPENFLRRLFVVDVFDVVDVEGDEPVPEFPIKFFEPLRVREVDEHNFLTGKPRNVLLQPKL